MRASGVGTPLEVSSAGIKQGQSISQVATVAHNKYSSLAPPPPSPRLKHDKTPNPDREQYCFSWQAPVTYRPARPNAFPPLFCAKTRPISFRLAAPAHTGLERPASKAKKIEAQ